MKLVQSSYEIISQENTLEGIYKHIEKAARVCYKSEDKICEGSARKMVDFLISRKHYSPLEHGTIYMQMNASPAGDPYDRYLHNPYSKVNLHNGWAYITTNVRVLIENDWMNDLNFMCEPTKYHVKRVSVKLKCSIGVTREANRHRVNSICEQSTRYCNYSLDKFNNEISFILPEWVIKRTKETSKTYDPLTGYDRSYLLEMPILEAVTNHMVCEDRAISNWIESLKKSELDYFYLLSDECGLRPQEARGVLPLDTASEVMYTAFVSDWKHFFKLRCDNAAHPDIRVLAQAIEEEFKELKYI